MKNKTFISKCMIICLLIVGMSFSSYLFVENPVQVQAASKNGLVQENGYTYYYLNGVKQKGKIVTVNGKAYYLSKADGKVLNGIVKLYKSDGSYYYKYMDINSSTGYAKNGIVVNPNNGCKYYVDASGTILFGLQRDSSTNKLYLFDKTTLKMRTGWQTYNGYTYYFDPNTGEALSGLQTIDNQRYYFSNKNVLQKGKTVLINGKAYYLSKTDGKVLNGIVKLYKTDGSYYYKYMDVDSSTGYAKNGIVVNPNNGCKYYVDASGTILFGLQRDSSTNKLYLFDKTTLKMRTGWQVYNGYTYYFDPNTGEALSGLQTINSKRYYFSDKNVVQKSKTVEVDGKIYYCNSYGVIINGIVKHKNSTTGAYYYVYYDNTTDTGYPDIGGAEKGIVKTSTAAYCVDSSGVVQSGLQSINGKGYYFDPTTKIMLTGWQTYKDYTYYFDPNTGESLTGWQEIEGKIYWLYKGSSGYGVLQKTGGVVQDAETGKRYYLSAETGEALTGVYPMGDAGYSYYFDPNEDSGLVVDEGLHVKNGQIYYFVKTSTLYSYVYEGLKYIHDGNSTDGVYYFDLDNGAALVNASITVGATTFNFDENGRATWNINDTNEHIQKMFDFGLSCLGKEYVAIVPDTREEGKNQLLTMNTYVCNIFVAACYYAGFDSFEMYENEESYSLTPPKQALKCYEDGTYFYDLLSLQIGDFVFFNDETCEPETCNYIVDIDGYRTNIHHIAIYMGNDDKYYYCLDASETENSVRIYRIPKDKMQPIQWTTENSEELQNQFYVTAFGRIG